MSYATKFNKGNKFIFKPSKDAVYLSLEELFNKDPDAAHPVRALYINTKSKFGDAPVVVVDSLVMVNLPKHLMDTVKEMINDINCVDAINNGEVSFKVYSYRDTAYNKLCYSVNWL